MPFHADSNELLFVSIALTFVEISVDFDRSWLSTSIFHERWRTFRTTKKGEHRVVAHINWFRVADLRRSVAASTGPTVQGLRLDRHQVTTPPLFRPRRPRLIGHCDPTKWICGMWSRVRPIRTVHTLRNRKTKLGYLGPYKLPGDTNK